jgi:hypothetical protein
MTVYKSGVATLKAARSRSAEPDFEILNGIRPGTATQLRA